GAAPGCPVLVPQLSVLLEADGADPRIGEMPQRHAAHGSDTHHDDVGIEQRGAGMTGRPLRHGNLHDVRARSIALMYASRQEGVNTVMKTTGNKSGVESGDAESPVDPPLHERVAALADRMSACERTVAQYMADHPEIVVSCSAIQLAAQIGTSDATVVRAAKALG